jgi:hypothetical protein
MYEMQARAKRFSIQRPLEFRLRGFGGGSLGSGRTVNISRRGLLFETDHDIGLGAKIECIVEMGPTDDGGPDVNLHVQGVTVRSQRGTVAVAIRKYRLKPRAAAGASSGAVAASR